ncbi:hypothetical protein GE09DRAFT_386008 [Coniochaeta sp. 2T2.1]|nr:hypothetical protein GE09DRAFT_386008 [Coniochaeta sp. 2T2.1]
MKRKLPPEGATDAQACGLDTSTGRSRRQPQISCDLCRHKKLKCDRGRPCSNCVARGKECQGGPVFASVSGVADSAQILERLRRLEEAVFATKDGVLQDVQDTKARTRASKDTTPSHPLPTPSTDLDYPSVGDDGPSDTRANYTFQVAEPMAPSTTQPPCTSEASPCVLLPAKQDTLAMFDYFLRTSHCNPRAIHVPYARSAISNFYSRNLGVRSRARQPPDAAVAAFIFSFCATAAFFWDKRGFPTHQLFSSVDQAVRKSNVWLNATWDLLDQSRRLAGSGSLQEVQAYLVLSDLLYNMEGCSTRFRYLHNRALTVAREIQLHLIDFATGTRPDDSDPLTEVKRRLWWHIASTDWLLSTMGGPLDRTYQVHPRHMMVHYPRNVNLDDLSTTFPASTVTDMTYFLLRTRLAEVCRKVADALPLGSPEIDSLPYDQVLAIGQLFEDAWTAMPPVFAIDTPLHPDTPPSAMTDRQIVTLAFHARRARIFRPFLLPEQPRPGRNLDPRRARFRSLCLQSARSVLRIASALLLKSIEESEASPWPLPLMHRSGCVISHLFMACVVLATDTKLIHTNGDDVFNWEVEAIRIELSDARLVLERVAEKSNMASSLVSKLIGVLKRHSGHTVVASSMKKQPEEARYAGGMTTPSGTDTTTSQGTASANSTLTPNIEAVAPDWTEKQPSGCDPADPVDGPEGNSTEFGWDSATNTDYYNNPALDGIEWAALMGNGFTDADSWGQLFADLDTAFPASM